MKIIDLLWALSLISIGICTVILVGINFLSIDLSDFIIRIVGLIDLAALPILGYTTVKKLKNKQQ